MCGWNIPSETNCSTGAPRTKGRERLMYGPWSNGELRVFSRERRVRICSWSRSSAKAYAVSWYLRKLPTTFSVNAMGLRAISLLLDHAPIRSIDLAFHLQALPRRDLMRIHPASENILRRFFLLLCLSTVARIHPPP